MGSFDVAVVIDAYLASHEGSRCRTGALEYLFAGHDDFDWRGGFLG